MESNVKKMREVLEKISEQFYDGCDGNHYAQLNESAYQMIKAALTEPFHNCDIGTIEEQMKQMDAYCASHGECIGRS